MILAKVAGCCKRIFEPALIHRLSWLLVPALVLWGLSSAGGRISEPNPSGSHPGARQNLRILAHLKAEDEFRKFHLFANGHGLHSVPGIMPHYQTVNRIAGSWLRNKILVERWGLIIEQGEPAGLHEVRYGDLRLAVFGCIACHGGRAAGRFYPGLGNKTIDVTQMGKEALRIQTLYSRLPIQKSDEYLNVERSALELNRSIADEESGNLTQGMVSTAVIARWFYRQANREFPRAMRRGAVKVPALWGYDAKRTVGQFCDGIGDGSAAGWFAAVELAAGQKPANVKRYLGRLREFETWISDLLPPKYPYSLDLRMAEKGKDVFAQRCRSCHGSYEYDAARLPIYRSPVRVSWERVRTDADRLQLTTDEFFELVAQNPLSDVIRVKRQPPGYIAPRLNGIWSRFPYLHNGSVPNLASLLEPPDMRPRVFSLEDAGEVYRFDPRAVGLTVPEASSESALRLMRGAAEGARSVYSTHRPGHSNEGHPFGVSLPANEKLSLIEYLKTL